ncbi:uncharacterized protein TrAtP1_000850 [Trichoderma atroviride]|uniref:uncharacterized protein n=1 Tax=Hypocrea atroviridis TaxID=63577 RepID=UPI003333A2F7|nr:hypothetical protein TrAtP1_000850 [Trichoderma atroviride]
MPDTDPANPGRDTSAEAGARDNAGEGSSSSGPVPPVPEEDPMRVPRYLRLNRGLLPSDSSWSNDPNLMNLETYFSRDPEVPSLAESFNLDNLIPIMVKVDYDRGDTYLLTVYKTNNYYLWNETDTAMWAFRKPNKGSLELEHVIELVRTETYGGKDLIQQYRSSEGSWGQG